MSRLLVIAGVSLTVGWFAFYYLTKVSEPDIYAHNYFKLPVRAQPVRAGDIVVLPDEPGGMTRLCDLNLDTVQVSGAPVADYYYNSLRESLPRFSRYVAFLAGLVGAAPDAPLADDGKSGIVFVGEKTALDLVESAPAMTESCECEMARAMSRGERVCTINASLVETRLFEGQTVSTTVAVTLARHTNYVSEGKFAQCGVPFTRDAAIVQQMLCSDHDALPPDVKIRRRLNLIDKEPLQAVSLAALPD